VERTPARSGRGRCWSSRVGCRCMSRRSGRVIGGCGGWRRGGVGIRRRGRVARRWRRRRSWWPTYGGWERQEALTGVGRVEQQRPRDREAPKQCGGSGSSLHTTSRQRSPRSPTSLPGTPSATVRHRQR